ncbi:hypothetical protein BGZ68_004901 [Mortierella alpina]|nr:hypothetical protein BGZ68_004901 [Mortierella alpina]
MRVPEKVGGTFKNGHASLSYQLTANVHIRRGKELFVLQHHIPLSLFELVQIRSATKIASPHDLHPHPAGGSSSSTPSTTSSLSSTSSCSSASSEGKRTSGVRFVIPKSNSVLGTAKSHGANIKVVFSNDSTAASAPERGSRPLLGDDRSPKCPLSGRDVVCDNVTLDMFVVKSDIMKVVDIKVSLVETTQIYSLLDNEHDGHGASYPVSTRTAAEKAGQDTPRRRLIETHVNKIARDYVPAQAEENHANDNHLKGYYEDYEDFRTARSLTMYKLCMRIPESALTIPDRELLNVEYMFVIKFFFKDRIGAFLELPIEIVSQYNHNRISTISGAISCVSNSVQIALPPVPILVKRSESYNSDLSSTGGEKKANSQGAQTTCAGPRRQSRDSHSVDSTTALHAGEGSGQKVPKVKDPKTPRRRASISVVPIRTSSLQPPTRPAREPNVQDSAGRHLDFQENSGLVEQPTAGVQSPEAQEFQGKTATSTQKAGNCIQASSQVPRSELDAIDGKGHEGAHGRASSSSAQRPKVQSSPPIPVKSCLKKRSTGSPPGDTANIAAASAKSDGAAVLCAPPGGTLKKKVSFATGSTPLPSPTGSQISLVGLGSVESPYATNFTTANYNLHHPSRLSLLEKQHLDHQLQDLNVPRSQTGSDGENDEDDSGNEDLEDEEDEDEDEEYEDDFEDEDDFARETEEQRIERRRLARVAWLAKYGDAFKQVYGAVPDLPPI